MTPRLKILPVHVIIDSIHYGAPSFSYASSTRQQMLRMRELVKPDYFAEYWGCIDGGDQKANWYYTEDSSYLERVPAPVRELFSYIYILYRDNSFTFIKLQDTSVGAEKKTPLFSYDILRDAGKVPSIGALSKIRTDNA